MARDDLQDTDYLGDGVYVGHDGFNIWLYLGDGHAPRSAQEGIGLEPNVLDALDRYRERLAERPDPAAPQVGGEGGG